ncbi:MAG: transporter [Acidobacteria bacterium]|nr:transporter [Acidobacteriota bacterium]
MKFWRTAIVLSLIIALWMVLMPAVASGQVPSRRSGITLFTDGSFFAYSGILNRRSSLLLHGEKISAPDGDRVQVFVQPLAFGFALNRDISLVGVVPVVSKRKSFQPLLGPSRSALGGSVGIGDVTVLAKWRFLKLDRPGGTVQLALVGGAQLPTGATDLRSDDRGQLLPPTLQRGTGTVNFLAGFGGTYVNRRFTTHFSGLYVINREGEQDFEPGDAVEVSVQPGYRIWQRPFPGPEMGIGINLFVESQGHARGTGTILPDSGGTRVFVGPTIWLNFKPDMGVQVGVDFPVFQDLNGAQLEYRPRLTVGFVKLFWF